MTILEPLASVALRDGAAAAGPAGQLAASLTTLKERTCRSYRALGRRTGLSTSALQRYCSGTSVPEQFEPLNRFALGCGASRGARAELFRLWVLADADRRQVRTHPTGGPHRRIALVRTPAQLPGTVAAFTGRTAELAELERVAARGAIVAVTGAPGCGKTALVLRWAHHACGRFGDGQLYADLRGYAPDRPVPATDVLAGFLDALGVTGADLPGDVDRLAARFRTECSGRRMLVVLDNAATADDVRPLLPGPSCLTMVTSRDSLAGLVARDGARRLRLDALPQGQAIELVCALVGERADDERAAVAELALRCGGLPLALRLVAELALARPGIGLRRIADELADPARRLELLAAGGDRRTGLDAVFSWSYRRLGAQEARAFRLLGLHPGPDATATEIATLAGCASGQASATLDRLAGLSLVCRTGTDRFTVPEPLRSFVRGVGTGVDDLLASSHAATASVPGSRG